MPDSRLTFVILPAVVVLSIAIPAVQANRYAVNGFSCSFPQGVPALDQIVVKEVASSSRFVAVTGGQPYSLRYWSNITSGLETYKNVTFQPTQALELGFATNGSATSCSDPSPWTNWIDVQVPFINGTYVVSSESVHSIGGHK